MKDNFSGTASSYAKFRPDYPAELVEYLADLSPQKNIAWDCGTGNGQLAVKLSAHFDTVYATDISSKQLDHAPQKENIIYIEEPAEQTDFDDEMFDLITVAQAVHWFQFDNFYKEVNRCLKPNGVFAVIGYGLMKVNPATDAVILDFYKNIVGSYWDAERRYIDEGYQTIPFPFNELKAPAYSNVCEWNVQQLLGYLNTWSAVQHYIKKHKTNPVNLIEEHLKNLWRDEIFPVQFEMLLRVGKK